MLHHVGKGQDGAKAGKDKPTIADRMSTEWVRGSSAIVDNFRCVLQLAQIREDEAEGAGLDPEAARQGQYIVFGATKVNGAPRGDMRFLEQDEHGRWFLPEEGVETLAKLRGKRAVAALSKQMALLLELHSGTRWGAEPDLKAIENRLFSESRKPNAALKQAIYNLRKSGFVQKNSYSLTVQGLQQAKSVTDVTKGDSENV
jgi:hypothetical protein